MLHAGPVIVQSAQPTLRIDLPATALTNLKLHNPTSALIVRVQRFCISTLNMVTNDSEKMLFKYGAVKGLKLPSLLSKSL